jgi:alpha/beta superfamily hydrolase
LKSEKIEFLSDGYKLPGLLTYTNETPTCASIILHPHPLYGGDMENYVVKSLEHVLLEEGHVTLRFDFRGTPSSPQGYSGIEGAVKDTSNAIDFLVSHTGISVFGIAGYSFGASVALRLAIAKPPQFLISLSASLSLIADGGYGIELLTKIQCPVLLFHGQQDMMIPLSDFHRLKQSMRVNEERAILLDEENHFYQNSLSQVTSEVRNFIRNITIPMKK